MTRESAALPATLVAALAALLSYGSSVTSVTVDEFFHVPVGLAYWQTGDFALYHHNPPLVRLLAAAPLRAAGVVAPLEGGPLEPWPLGDRFLQAYADRYHAVITAARSVIILLTCATALLLFVVARRALGSLPAAVALALFVTCPTVLAHGGLATTDAGFCLAFFAACVQGGRFLAAPSWRRCVALGLLLGLAQLTKLTALLLYPLLALSAIALPLLARHLDGGASLGWMGLAPVARLVRVATAVVVSLLVLNAGYLFDGTGRPLSAHTLHHPLLQALAASPAGGVPVPLPVELVLGFDDQYVEASGHFVVYLLGESRTDGWWYYYFLVILFKLPIALLVLAGALVVSILGGRVRPTPLLAGCLAVPLFSFVAFTTLTNVDLGVRYLLFLLPFVHLAIAHLAHGPLSRVRVALLAAGLAGQAASSLTTYPHSISYFNELCGRWSNGHRYLADSNLDWGQDLIHLRRWMTANGIDSVALSHFGPVDPAVYGIAWRPLDAPPQGGVVAISVNHLLGITPWGEPAGLDRYRGREPIERVGASLWLFKED